MQLLSSASAALQKSDPKLSLETSRRTFGALPPFIPCTTARHNLATSFTRALSEPEPIATHSSSRHHARVNSRPNVLCIRSTMSNSQRTSAKAQTSDPHSQFSFFLERSRTGGAERDRTDDLLLAKQALSQLSYGPSKWAQPASASSSRSQSWWAREDLNFRPHAYQARALTN